MLSSHYVPYGPTDLEGKYSGKMPVHLYLSFLPDGLFGSSCTVPVLYPLLAFLSDGLDGGPLSDGAGAATVKEVFK